MKRLLDSVPVAFLWRYAAHSAMVALALWNEARPAPGPLPDAVLAVVPKVAWIEAYNYHLWLLCYLPPAIWLWRRDRAAFVHFLWVGGVLSLVRGICIPLTGLGPISGHDVNAGMTGEQMWRAWLGIVNPLSALTTDVAKVSLTKDLFFSGHASTMLLLWLYCRPHRPLGAVALAANAIVLATVYLSHLHYTIDIIGAWAITWIVFAVAMKRWPPGSRQLPAGRRQPSADEKTATPEDVAVR